MDAADEDESEPTPSPTPEPEQTPDIPDETHSDENDDEPVVSNVEWKEFLRVYEEWIDSYIELLEKYNYRTITKLRNDAVGNIA